MVRKGEYKCKYYKSVRLIDGKSRWVITDEYDNIVDKNPTKEQLKSAAIIDGRKRTRFSVPFKERKCCICGKDETYVTNSGTSQWFDHICNKIDCTKCMCKICYSRGYYENSRDYVINGPDSNNYIIKLMRPCRSDDIYSKKFSELNNQQIGRIGEDIVIPVEDPEHEMPPLIKETEGYGTFHDLSEAESKVRGLNIRYTENHV